MSSNSDRPEPLRRRVPDPRAGDPASRPVIQFPGVPPQPQTRPSRSRAKGVPPSEFRPSPPPPRSNRRRRSRRSRPDRGPQPVPSVNPPQPSRPGAATARPQRAPAPPRRSRSASRRSAQPPKLLVYFTRLVVLGVGVAGIAGTTLSIWNPALRSNQQTAVPIRQGVVSQPLPGGQRASRDSALPLGKELNDLKASVATLATQTPGLTLSAFLYDLETGAYFNLQGSEPIAAASTIKVPILVAFLQDVDAGKIRLDESLTLRETQIATGSGDMQDQPPGTVYTALETASWMIISSDNTATNMLIDRLGGAEKLNERFRSWGLNNTAIRNPLPDLDGTNTTSPEDLTKTLALVERGELLSLRSRDRLFAIMQRTQTDSLLPQGLGEDALIAHKTGDIGALVADVGLVDAPNGKRYIIAAMVKRPHNDGRAQELIRLVSRAVYDDIGAPLKPAAPRNAPAAQPSPEQPQEGAAEPSNETSPSSSESTSSGE